jgi:hypothetical protein
MLSPTIRTASSDLQHSSLIPRDTPKLSFSLLLDHTYPSIHIILTTRHTKISHVTLSTASPVQNSFRRRSITLSTTLTSFAITCLYAYSVSQAFSSLQIHLELRIAPAEFDMSSKVLSSASQSSLSLPVSISICASDFRSDSSSSLSSLPLNFESFHCWRRGLEDCEVTVKYQHHAGIQQQQLRPFQTLPTQTDNCQPLRLP